VWRGDYECGDFSQFRETAWNNRPLAPAIATWPVRDGRYSGRYVVPAGGERSEGVPDLAPLRAGDDCWFSFSTLLGDDVPLDTAAFQLLAQWKNTGPGSPPLELALNRGQLMFGGGWGWPGTNTPTAPRLARRSLGPAQAGRWDDWVVHVRFSADPAIGCVDVWRNDVHRVVAWHPPGGTLYPHLDSYLKVGYYRDCSIGRSSTVYHDSWKVGRSRLSVAWEVPAALLFRP
jgi:polysaccharide lyase-like protein